MRMDELDAIRERYDKRKSGSPTKPGSASTTYNRYISAEREKVYRKIITGTFPDPSQLKFLEIGAGNGSNLPFFNRLGIPWTSIQANELLNERVAALKKNFPEVKIYEGDALQIPGDAAFDIVFQSTVFTSVLSDAFKQKLAAKMWQLTRPGGLVLWYDFIYDNPSNKDVKGVPVKEVKQLFSEAKSISVYPVTLAPPIGRRVGGLYHLFNALPFLRSHVVIAIRK
jgi:SAM-dependent methyltransferase